LNDDVTKNELIEMIVSAGLLEDLIGFLKRKKVNVDDIKTIYEIDSNLIQEYALEKKILIKTDPVESSQEDYTEEKYEPRRVKPKTPPRRKE